MRNLTVQRGVDFRKKSENYVTSFGGGYYSPLYKN